jgi:hypothetical protein
VVAAIAVHAAYVADVAPDRIDVVVVVAAAAADVLVASA